jgi:hypothetical protein
MIAGGPEAGCAPLVVRTPKDDWDGDNALSQNFSLAVHVLQKEAKRFKPLLEAAYDLIPFIARKNLRQQVTEPRIVVISGREFEYDPQLSQSRV